MSPYRFSLQLLLCLATTLLGAPVLATDPPTQPFPRIEANQHTAPIYRIDVDAKGRWLVSASHDKTARVWDLRSGALLQVLRPPIGPNHEGKLYAVALSPDGTTVAVGGWDVSGPPNSIYLFDRKTGVLEQRICCLPSGILHLAFSPDGRRLAAALGAGEGIRVYRADSWAEIGRDEGYGERSSWISFGSQGRLASSCYDGFIRLYDADLQLLAKQQAPGGEWPFAVSFSPDGSRIAVGFNDSRTVNVLSAVDLSLLYTPDTSGIDNYDLSKVSWSHDGRTLFAGGRYQTSNSHPLVSWSEMDRGPRNEHLISKNTIMDLVPLANDRMAFGSQDPAWGLLDADGKLLVGRGPAIGDFRTPSDVLRLSEDGSITELDFDVLDAKQDWRKHVLRLDLSQRRLTLDPGDEIEQLQRRLQTLGYAPGRIDGIKGLQTRKSLEAFQRDRGLAASGDLNPATRKALGIPRLQPPSTTSPALRITDWQNRYAPKLEGKALSLERFNRSRCLAIAEDARSFLLGTHWYLRRYNRKGELLWRTPAPATTWMVNLSADGRWAVAAFGDGSVRWFEAATGEERLALFIDAVEIAKLDESGAAAANAASADVPWVLWTPEGFFDSGGGGDRLMGWHLNRGADQAGELIDAEQLGEVFRRPDLVARALDPDYSRLARAALDEIGDLKRLLTGSKPPQLALRGPAQVQQARRDYKARFTVEDRGGGVGRIEYRVNGVLVGQGDLRGRFGLGLPKRRAETRPFTLDPGSHRIEARAFDAKDQLASPWVAWEVEVTDEQRRAPALYGLAVGIGPYKDDTLSLEYGDDDAEAFVVAINGAASGLYREVQIESLVNDQATLEGITQAFSAMAAKAQPEDVFVLFLAGHGLVQDGRYHFIPWDLRYSNRKALELGSLNEDRLRDLLAQVQARKSLVVLDSCYAGALLDAEIKLAGLIRRGGEALETRAAIDRLMNKTGRAVLASSTSRDFALEGLDGHGVFTYVLLEGLRGRADLLGDRDGTIQTGELADYLEEEVPRISRRVWHYEQYPMRDLQGQSFAIGLRKAKP